MFKSCHSVQNCPILRLVIVNLSSRYWWLVNQNQKLRKCRQRKTVLLNEEEEIVIETWPQLSIKLTHESSLVFPHSLREMTHRIVVPVKTLTTYLSGNILECRVSDFAVIEWHQNIDGNRLQYINVFYHSTHCFLPFHWPRAHHVTCKLLPAHSRPQSPRSFWVAAGIESSGNNHFRHAL